MNNVIELYVKIYLQEDIKLEDTQQKICSLIDKTLIQDKEFDEFHRKNMYKNYSFNLLYPLAADKLYKHDNLYTFIIRTVDKSLSDFLIKELKNQYTNEIKVLTIDKKIIPIRHIESVYSITPIVAKFPEGYWKDNYTINTLEKRIRENLIKKYNNFYNTKIDEDFELFISMNIINKVPISTKYKDIKILGDKISFNIAENDSAQKIINFTLGVGLGELGARGYGFVNYKWM